MAIHNLYSDPFVYLRQIAVLRQENERLRQERDAWQHKYESLVHVGTAVASSWLQMLESEVPGPDLRPVYDAAEVS